MEIASLIVSVISLLLSMSSIIWLIAKQLSTHTIQYVNPFETKENPLAQEMGKDPAKMFREIGEPLDSDELDYIEEMRNRKAGR